jgi:hypothetical protein
MLISLEEEGEEGEGILYSKIKNIFALCFKFMICVNNFAVIGPKLT